MTAAAAATTSAPNLELVDSWTSYRASWLRSLRAANKSATTLTAYLGGLDDLADWARARGILDPVAVRRGHLEDYIGEMYERPSGRGGGHLSASTVATRYRQIRVFFGWLVEREEIDSSPMRGMHEPKVDQKVTPVLSTEDVDALLDACLEGRGKPGSSSAFSARRDHAMILLFSTGGLRRAELIGLRLEDVHLDDGWLLVTQGKGRKERIVPITRKTSEALDAYLRARSRHKDHKLPELWLAGFPHRGALGYQGIATMLNRRARQAGIPGGVHAHQLRHTTAHNMKVAGMNEDELMAMFGWSPGSREMLNRYGASATQQRMLATARRLDR